MLIISFVATSIAALSSIWILGSLFAIRITLIIVKINHGRPKDIKSNTKVTSSVLESIEDHDLFKFVLKTEAGNIALAAMQNQFDKLSEKFSEDLEQITQKISQHDDLGPGIQKKVKVYFRKF